MNKQAITIAGAGLAGSEAALQLANRGYSVTLYDMKPRTRSAAHHSNQFAEIVCSNSFGSQNSVDDAGNPSVTASGLLKEEMQALGCQLLAIAQSVSVPAGKALAVDREAFSQKVTDALLTHPLITLVPDPLTVIPSDGITLIATGPLTTPALAETISNHLGQDQLYFFDAASPIIATQSIDTNIAFKQDRYQLEKSPNKPTANTPESPESSEAADGHYINCPLDKDEYQQFYTRLQQAERAPLKAFEKESNPKTKTPYFESCLPVEVIASRGVDTLRFGPMKPVGLIDPKTGKRPYAVVQLRQDNAEGTLYNMVGFQTNLKWGEQKALIQSIPGLQHAEIVRYGVMHRNTYIDSPTVLLPTLQHKSTPTLFFAGQLTGTEGYTESIATGLLAAINIDNLIQERTLTVLPKTTMLGALLQYITRAEAANKNFQPINSNWGILKPLSADDTMLKTFRKNKKLRNQHYVERALTAIQAYC